MILRASPQNWQRRENNWINGETLGWSAGQDNQRKLTGDYEEENLLLKNYRNQ